VPTKRQRKEGKAEELQRQKAKPKDIKKQAKKRKAAVYVEPIANHFCMPVVFHAVSQETVRICHNYNYMFSFQLLAWQTTSLLAITLTHHS
jgi:hypothetical protein